MGIEEEFRNTITESFTFKGDSILMGCGMLNGQPVEGLKVKAALKMFNRHGLIAGATGTGKTKTLQLIAESLATKGVSSLVMDIKGDLSGIAQPGTSNDKIEDRARKAGTTWQPLQLSAEILSLSDEKGLPMRATVSEFGPVLFSKILELNDTQQGVVSLLFKYCDDNKLPLLDLKDFKKTLQYLTNDGKEFLKKEYGTISTSSASTILRKVIEIEQQGADKFFGERSFDVEDLIKIDENGFGKINILRLSDMQSKPKLFSTFMLCLLAEIYEKFPEEGDAEQPKLCLFVDEAHLIFEEASKTLLNQIETIIKLIRSKAVGVFFITQLPDDVPASILSQLGLKVQHALRAFTANDRKAILKAAANFPETKFYKTDALLTEMGIGEAFITSLNEKGIPTALVHTLLCAPATRMDVLTQDEIDNLVNRSALVKKYIQTIDRESAYELLNKKIAQAIDEEESSDSETQKPQKTGKPEKSIIEQAVDSTAGRQVMRTVARELTRGLLGVLGVGGASRSRKKTGWF